MEPRPTQEAMRSNRLLAALAVVSTLSASQTAWAYCRTTTVNEPDNYEPTIRGCWSEGVPLAWPDAPIGVRIDSRASRKVPLAVAQRSVVESFAKWSNVTCESGARPSFTVQHLEPAVIEVSDCTNADCVSERLSAAGAIVFRDDVWPHDDGGRTFALTTVTFGTRTGRVVGAFMEINTAQNDFVEHGPGTSDEVGLDYVISHEAGHFLALAHSDDGNALMHTQYKDSDPSLQSDDRAAICAIAPWRKEPTDKGCGCDLAHHSSSGAAAFATLLAMAIASRRHGRRRSL